MKRRGWMWMIVPALFGCPADETESPALEDGLAWKVDLASGVLESPPNLDELNDFLVSDYPFYLGIESLEKGSMDLMFAIAGQGGVGQDLCSRTITMPEVSLIDGQEIAFGPDTFVMANGITTLDMTLSGVFSNDLATLKEMSVTGLVVVESIPDEFEHG